MIFAIGGVPPFSGFPGKVLIFQGALQNGNYIGLALMIITSLIAMYSLFRILFYMYFGDKDGRKLILRKSRYIEKEFKYFSSCGYRNRNCCTCCVKCYK